MKKKLDEFLNKNNLGDSLESLRDVKCEFLCNNLSLMYIYEDTLPIVNYYLISKNDESTILKETIDRADRKSYQLLFPLAKRKIKHSDGLIIIYNEEDRRYGIYNLMTNKFELNEINIFELIDFFDNNSGKSRQCFIVKNKKSGGLGLLLLKNGKQLIIPAKFLEIKELMAASVLSAYEVEDKNHKHGVYAYYTVKSCRYLDSEKNVYYNSLKSSVIPPLFDELGRLYYTTKNHYPTGDEICWGIYIEVVVDGKLGLLDVINKYLVIPPVFDRIETSGVNNQLGYFGDTTKFLNSLCGYIGDKKYFYLNGQLCEINVVEFDDERAIELTKKLNRTKRKK